MDVKCEMGEILEAEKQSGAKFDYFRVTFADMHGIARSQLVPRRHIQSSVENGMTLFSGKGCCFSENEDG